MWDLVRFNRARTARMAFDPRTWIALFFLIRLIGITNAPIEIGHAWRQCLTAMISRNFNETGFDLLRPKVDMGGDRTGIIGSEFPLLNALIAIANGLFGPTHWYGRLIVLAVSSLGVWHFSKLVNILFSTRVAIAATIILLASIWFQFSRKIMPDTFSVGLMLIALHQGALFLFRGGIARLLAFSLLSLLAGMSKMPALCLMAALLVPLMDIGLIRGRRLMMAVACIPTAIGVSLWYFYWVPYLVDTYHYQLYYPRQLLVGLLEIWHFRSLTATMFYFEAFRSYIAFAFFLFGFWTLMTQQTMPIRVGFGLISLVFAFFILKAGDVFSKHGYYIVPFVPVMAVVAALALEHLPQRWAFVALLAIGLEGTANQFYDLFVPERRLYLLNLEALADRFVPAGGRVIVNGDLDPEYMYFLHRRGWSVPNNQCNDIGFVRAAVGNGATTIFLFGNSTAVQMPFPSLYSDQHVRIISLTGQ